MKIHYHVTQEPASGPYPQPDASSTHTLPPYFPKIHYNIYLPIYT